MHTLLFIDNFWESRLSFEETSILYKQLKPAVIKLSFGDLGLCFSFSSVSVPSPWLTENAHGKNCLLQVLVHRSSLAQLRQKGLLPSTKALIPWCPAICTRKSALICYQQVGRGGPARKYCFQLFSNAGGLMETWPKLHVARVTSRTGWSHLQRLGHGVSIQEEHRTKEKNKMGPDIQWEWPVLLCSLSKKSRLPKAAFQNIPSVPASQAGNGNALSAAVIFLWHTKEAGIRSKERWPLWDTPKKRRAEALSINREVKISGWGGRGQQTPL